jgi:hypothetical protein
MLGILLSAAWSVISADDFAIPRWVIQEAMTLLAGMGSA